MSILAKLLGDVSFNFNEPIIQHSRQDDLEELFSHPALKGLEEFLSFWPGPVDAHDAIKADEAFTTHVSAEEAKECFSQGMGLLCNDIDQVMPMLRDWCDQLEHELSLPHMTYGRSLLYATPKEGGTTLHFDQNINFIIQLTGKKKWFIAKNHNVQNPLTRHSLHCDMDPELASYFEGDLPRDIPEDAQEITLKAGSVLFLPAGYWHETYADTDALAINFTFTVPAFVDLALAALRSKLVMEPEWREMVHFKDQKSDPAQRFDGLLKKLEKEVSSWKSEQVISLFKKGE